MLPRIFSEIFGGVWLMDKSSADSYMPLIISILKGDFQKNGIDFSEARQKNNVRYISTNGTLFTISEYGEQIPPEKAPVNSIAVVNIIDAISKYDMACGPAGMKTKANILQRIFSTSNIKGVILNIDSGGGEGNAMRYLTEIIDQRNKPVISFIDDLGASAAAGIAVSTDWVTANHSLAKFGSFGTYLTYWDYSEYWKKEGIIPKEVYADKSTDKNKEYYDALKGDISGIKEIANRFNDHFLSMVSNYRSEKLKNDSWKTGKLFDADKALEIGLIDEIATWEETVYSFAQSLNIL